MIDVAGGELVNEGESDEDDDKRWHGTEKDGGRCGSRMREKENEAKAVAQRTYVWDTVREEARERKGGKERRVILVRVSKSECNNAHSSTGAS